eukprot:3294404-Amphidinium_carterae.1
MAVSLFSVTLRQILSQSFTLVCMSGFRYRRGIVLFRERQKLFLNATLSGSCSYCTHEQTVE